MSPRPLAGVRAHPYAMFALLLAWSLWPVRSSAEPARVLDRINGDQHTVLSWSEGSWSVDHVPTCFTGGGVTGPGSLTSADSVICPQRPNSWDWDVILPGPFTLHYSFQGMPPGYTVCGQIFAARGLPGVEANVDLPADWMVCTNAETGEVIWSGRFSDFSPNERDFMIISATRCGRITPLPTGACCFPDGSCQVVIQEECPPPGVWMGETAGCDPNPCPQPTGACCLAGGECVYLTVAACAEAQGLFQETGVGCSPNPCFQPTGACCVAGGECLELTEAACAEAQGFFQQIGVRCSPNPCAQPTGACCAADGECLVLTEAACAEAQGSFQGIGGLCSPNPCPQPAGACCLSGGECVDLTAAACADAQGTYLGNGVSCVPNPCPSPSDRSSWGRIKANYR